MDEGPSRAASLQAGALAGTAGFATFLLLHHLWIVPIWFIAPVGLLVAVSAGAAVGAAYAELQPRLPPRPWTAIAVIALIGVVVLPAVAIAELRGAIFRMEADGGGALLVPAVDAVADFVVGLLGTAALTGGALGWLIARRLRAAGMTALAGLALALGPGHNIPLLGGTPAAPRELVILAVVGVVASFTLVEGHAWLIRLGRERPRPVR